MVQHTFDEYQELLFSSQDNLEKLQSIQDKFLEDFASLDAPNQDKKSFLADLDSLVKGLQETTPTEQEEDFEFALDYDFSKYELHVTPLETLNESDLPYPIFLRDVVIPTFHPLPYPEIQNHILATVCLINNSSIPPKSPKNAKEVPLSPIYIQGVSGSGKSQATHLISRHYSTQRAVSVTGSNTGGDLIQKMTDASYRSGSLNDGSLKLYPSVIFMENFYNRDMDRWGHFATQLLATERSFATTARQGKDAKVFYTFLLKVFTSVQPLQAIKEQNIELLRRTIRLFTQKQVPKDSTANYDWTLCKNEYLKLWQPQNVEDKFFPILQEVVTKPDDATVIPPDKYLPSQIIIATGVFAGIWRNLEEAEAHMAEYWKLVTKHENTSGKPYLEAFNDALKGYWREYNTQVSMGTTEYLADKIASEAYLNADSLLKDTMQVYGNFYPQREVSEALQNYMQSKGFTYMAINYGKMSVFKQFND